MLNKSCTYNSSILVKIRAIFIIAFVSLIFATTTFMFSSMSANIGKLMSKTNLLETKSLIHDEAEFKKIFTNLNSQFINDPLMVETIVDEGYITPLPERVKRLTSQKYHYSLIYFESHLYVLVQNTHEKYLIKDDDSFRHGFLSIVIVFIFFLVLLFFMYRAIKKAILPLKTLENEIVKFGNGDLNIDTRVEGNDEIARVANEFANAVDKINKLIQSRKLFLRNIMHELNTPITKGKIIAELIEDENKAMLESIFNRLQMLISEMAEVEKVTSKEQQIEYKEYLILDIIDNAKDLLFDEHEFSYEPGSNKIKGDFKLLSIAFKNLIDNGFKHGSNFRIFEEGTSIIFANKGEQLTSDLATLTSPFNHKNTNQKGLGLGLYITHEILKAHHYTLSYEHRDGENWFRIERAIEPTQEAPHTHS